MLNSDLLRRAQERLDSLTKPRGSLGELEEIAKRLFAIYADLNREISSKGIFVLAGDHGITEEGVSAYPQEVTRQMILNFVEGGAAISVLARSLDAKLFVADFGVIGPNFSNSIGRELYSRPGREHSSLPTVLDCKIAEGTRNFLREDAMTKGEALEAIQSGRDLLESLHAENKFDLIALGEMGIGNSTSAAAMTAAFAGVSVEKITGRGTGLKDDALKNKISIIEKSLAARKPDSKNPVEVLSKFGGYEIAGLTGIYLAASDLKIPCVIDGLISGAAALVAARIQPQSRNYFFASHLSEEPGHKVILDELKLHPILHGRLRLGEASGAALALPIIQNAWKLFREMATFESAGVSGKN